MGKTRTPKYRIESDIFRLRLRRIETTSEGADRIPKDLVDHAAGFAESVAPGKCNEHLLAYYDGALPYPNAMRVIRQSDGVIVKEWKAPTFFVWPKAKRAPADAVQFQKKAVA